MQRPFNQYTREIMRLKGGFQVAAGGSKSGHQQQQQ